VTSTTPAGIAYVDLFAAAARRFSAAIANTDLAAPVPACPTWSTYDLVVHLGNIHAWAATIVHTGSRADQPHEEPGSRAPRQVRQWYDATAARLGDVLGDVLGDALGSADLAGETWNFAGAPPTKVFWARRQLHETLMHLVDLDQAAHRPTRLDPDVSTDGIAEVLEVFIPRMHERGHRACLEEPLTMRTLDTDHVWTLQPRHDAPPFVAVRTEPGADLVEGTAAGLLTLLWKRSGTEHRDVSYVGNAGRIERFIASRLTP